MKPIIKWQSLGNILELQEHIVLYASELKDIMGNLKWKLKRMLSKCRQIEGFSTQKYTIQIMFVCYLSNPDLMILMDSFGDFKIKNYDMSDSD